MECPLASARLRHVGVDVDLVGEDGDVHLEAALHRGELVGVVLVRDEADGQALGAEATGAAHAVQVLVRSGGEALLDLGPGAALALLREICGGNKQAVRCGARRLPRAGARSAHRS